MKASRLLLLLLLLLVVLVCGVVLAAPSLLSTNFGKSILVDSINERIPGSVGIESISLSWFGGQRVLGITLKGQENGTILRLNRFDTEATLMELIRSRLSLGRTEISGLRANIETGADGVTNLEKSLVSSRPIPSSEPPPKAKTGAILPVPLSGEILLDDSVITLTDEGKEPVTLQDINGAVHMEAVDAPIRAEFRARALQGKLNGGISIDVSLSGFDSRGMFDAGRANGKMTVRLTDLPVDGIDQMLKQGGLLRAAVGNRLDLDADLEITKGDAKTSMKITSPLVSVDISATVADKSFRLDRQARIKAVLTSGLLEALTRETGPLKLSAGVPVEMRVDNLTTPVTGFQPNATAFTADLTVGDGMIRGKGAMDGLGWSGVSMSIETEKLAAAVNFKLDGAAEQEGRKGGFRVDAVLTDLFDNQGKVQAEKMSADATVEMKTLPVAMLDGLLGQQGLLVTALGSSIDVDATCKGTGAGSLEADIKVKSDRLEASLPLQLTNRIVLKMPATINYTVAPPLVSRFVSPDNLGLEKPFPLKVTVSRFSAPRPATGQAVFQPEDTVLDAELGLGDAALQSKTLGTVLLKKAGMKIKGENLAKFNLTGDLAVAPEQGMLRDAFGPDLALTLNASASFDANGKMQLPAISMDGKGTDLKRIFLRAAASKDFASLSLSEPARLDYSLPPELVARFLSKEGTITGLREPANMQLTVERLTASLSPFSLAATDASLRLTAARMDFAARAPIAAVSVDDITVALAASGADNRATFQVKGKTGFGKKKKAGAILLDGTVNGFHDKGTLDLTRAKSEITVDLKEVPVALAEIATDTGGLLPVLLGDTLAMEGRIKMTGFTEPQGNAVIKASAERMTLNADVALGRTVSFNAPAILNLNLTPGALSRLLSSGENEKSKPGYDLQKTAVLSAKIIKLTLPLPKKQGGEGMRIGNMALDADLSVRDLFLTDRTRTAGFELLQATLASATLASGLDFTLKGESVGSGPDGTGKLTVAGRLTNLVDAAGSFKPEAMSALLKTDGSNLPVSLLDILSGGQGKLVGILGNKMQVAGNVTSDLARKVARFSLSERTEHSSVEVEAMTENKHLKLAKEMAADLEVTPALGKIALAKVNPLLAKAVSADKPITLRVKKENFHIPIDPFAVKDILVDQARAEFGTITLENGGILKALLGFLRTGGTGDRITAQVTPIVAHVENGVATYERADFILDSGNRIASWGKIDLDKDRVEMVLGLTAETLDKIFDVEGLEPDYVLQIPVRGTTADPKVDWGRAGREIAALVAREKLGGQLPGGRLLEGILGGSTKPAPPAPAAPTREQQPQTGSQSAQPPAQGEQKQTTPQPSKQQDQLQQLLRQLIK